MKNKEIFNSILPILGVLLGAFLTFYFTELSWKNHLNYEIKSKLEEKKIELLDKTCSIFAKGQAFQEIYNFHKYKNTDLIGNEIVPKNIEISNKLGELKSEYISVIELDKLYFSTITKNKIDSVSNELVKKGKSWWEVPFSTFKPIIISMQHEIKTQEK